jgi:membrane protein DedA with SNARE-associated domain
MTLGYVANTYNVSYVELVERLGLAGDTLPDTTLFSVAEGKGLAPFDAAREVQTAIAALARVHSGGEAAGVTDESGSFSDAVLSNILAYSYPALGLVLMLGAIGLPVPTGFSTVLAGSMAAVGEIDAVPALAIVMVASVAGDVIGYEIGVVASERFLARRGRWIGFTPQRRERVVALFHRWGGLTVFLTRTLVSHLSSIASLLAGISRYHFWTFLIYATLGRALWTAAYFWLGYVIGNDIEAASAFLGHMTGLVVSLGAIVAAGSFFVTPLMQVRRP